MKNIVFVLDNIADYNSLTQNIADAQVFVLDSKGNALSQMAAILEDYSNLDAIHLFSHGSTGGGELNLGSLTLNNANASSYSDTLSRIGSSLSSNGDILLYGCNVANGQSGVEFIQTLADLTEADIAASDDLTGNSALGGDWVLEAHSGSVEADSLTISTYENLLATPILQSDIFPADGLSDYTATVLKNSNGSTDYTTWSPSDTSKNIFFWGNANNDLTYLLNIDTLNTATTWSIVTGPSHGTLSNTLSTASNTSGAPSSGTLVYTPTSDFTGNDSIVVRATTSGGVDTMTININTVEQHQLGGVATTGNLDVHVGGGQIYITRYNGTAWEQQYFSSSGAVIAIDGKQYALGTYYTYGLTKSLEEAKYVSQTQNGTKITTTWDAGGFLVDQIVELPTTTSKYIKLNYEITNSSGSTASDVRLFRGIDSYLAGGDNGAGFWDAATNTIGVIKDVGGISQVLRFQGITTPTWYSSKNYSEVGLGFIEDNSLNNDVDSNPAVDNGYALGWQKTSFANGSDWTIKTYESFTSAPVSVVGGDVETSSGGSVTLTYTVSNKSGVSQNVTYSAVLPTDWSGAVLSKASETIANNATSTVTITITPPSGQSAGLYDIGLTAATAGGDADAVGQVDMSVDITAPTLDGTHSTPADNSTTAVVGDNIVIDFNENIAFGSSGTITIYNVTTSQTVETFTVSSGSATGSNGSTATISNDKLTINPNGDLKAGTQYSVQFSVGSIVDTADTPNSLAAITDNTTYNFTTAASSVTLSVDDTTLEESIATATVTATLSKAASTDTTVTLAATGTATGGGTDYTLSSTTITITAGQTTGTASVTSVQDTLDEADETAIVSIDSVSGGGGATESGTQSVTVTISDDDATPTVSIADTSLSEGHAGSENMTFTATLSAASGRAVSVNYATSNGTASSGSDYTASSGTLNFAAGETTKTFTVAIWGDTNLEGNETITATLSNPTNATLGTSTATGTINDDENATPVNTVPSAQTTNEDVAKVFSTANGNAITVTDAENATLTTTVSIASGKGALGITASGHGATVSATAISIQLEGTATQINAALEGLTYTPTANANGAGYATLTVLTSDGVTADTDTVTINVTAVDDAPVANSMAASVSLNSKQLFSTFTPSFNDVEEDSPTHLKILSMPSTGSFEVYDGDGYRSDDANWAAVTGVDSSNPLTIAMADLGNYRFNAGSSTGAANVNWAVQTNEQWSNTATGVVTIVNSENNDAPVVNIYQANGTTSLNSGILTVAEDGASANVVLKFSDNITPEEFMQGIVQSSNSDIIDMSCISMVRSQTVAVGDTVTLTFTPKANAYGDVTIMLGASDGDKSATQTFTLSVTPTNEQAVAQDFLKTINEDGTFYFNIINPADIYADVNDANMNKGVNAVDYNAQMAIIATAQQEGATEEQITAAGTAITALVNASLFPNSFLIKTLPTHGKLYLGETEITTTDYSVAIADLASLTYVPTANYSGSDSFTWQGVDVGDLATTTKTATFTVNEVNDAQTGSVTISGTPTQGQTLTASNTLADVDGLGTITYQWKADGVAIDGATGETLVLGEAHVGKVITVVASYTDDHAHAESSTSTATAAIANLNDDPTGSVIISGTATQGETLTASNTLADVDGLGTITYQWKADGEAISGATSSTFVLGEAQVGKVITVTASYTDDRGTSESSTSTATAAIANLNDDPTGSVAISGTATQGQTLTVTNTLADLDGLGEIISYQWKADGVAIKGATGETLVLGEAHVGKIITVVASYTDGHETAESKASSATTAVVTPPPPSSGGGSTPTVPTTPTTPPATTTTVDGTTVQTTTTTQTRTTTDTNGHTTATTVSTEQIVIAPVTSNRAEQTGSTTTADIPLFWGESTRTEWATTANIPTGVGLASEGSRAPAATQTTQTALDDLIYYIDTTTPETDTGKGGMLNGGETFLQALSNIETLVVNKITLSTVNTEASQVPITITGVANTIATTNGSIAPQEALVIDAQTLPSHSTLQLQNVEFAVIIGEDLTIRGGEGRNILFSGAGSQNIMLGEDDDELHAGAGDDTVGSAGGDDQIFGEAGDDTVFGGEGNDMLHGGGNTDVTTYSGNMADYVITRDEGKTYVALASNSNEVDTLINVESIEFADSSYTIENSITLSKIATLYMQILDRQAEIDGFQYWAKDTTSLGNIALGFITSVEYKTNSGVNWETLDVSGKVEQFYEALLGRSSDEIGKAYWVDAINAGMTFEQAVEGFIDSVELSGIYQSKEDWNFTL